MKALSGALAFTLIFALPVFADYVETRDLTIPAEDIRELMIDCGAGYLEIEGVENLKNIEVEAEIVIGGLSRRKAQDFIEDYMVLSLEGKRGRARLDSFFEHSKRFLGSLFGHKSAQINLRVRTPVDIGLDIDDGSGDISIENISGGVDVEDGSGEMELSRIIGDVTIEDGSGEIDAFSFEGNVSIDDGSGDIFLEDIVGDAEIDDGSGDIVIKKVDGSIVVDDGSGDIKIRYVKKDVDIIDSGSGDVDIAYVDGRVRR
ncbi:MAG: hypothetical protein JSU69_08475 [Candidatus Zixiibacteriota bacterium]|nr:MAG: hypothetical protein JSU69_08475 [candidate division Zixibacteria bacterium]